MTMMWSFILVNVIFASNEIRLKKLLLSNVFFLSGFSFTNIHYHRTAGERGGYLFNSSLPLPLASQALRHQPGDYCRQRTSAHSQQPDSNREPLFSDCKSLTTKLRALETAKKLLVVTIDEHLNFNDHVTNICKSTSRKLDALVFSLKVLQKNKKNNA